MKSDKNVNKENNNSNTDNANTNKQQINPSIQPNTKNRLIGQSLQNKQRRAKQLIENPSIIKQDESNIQNQFQLKSNHQNLQNECIIQSFLQSLLEICKSQRFSNIYTFILILFTVNISLQACNINTYTNQITQYVSLILQIFFTFTILLKILNFHQQSIFLLIIDIITNMSGYMGFGLVSYSQADRYFRAVRTLRIGLIIKQIQVLNTQLANLIKSLRSVGKILFPAAMFIYFYAVIGLFLFRDYQFSKCRDPNNKILTQNWTVYTSQIFLCGEKDCPIVNGVQYECLNPIDFGLQPNEEQINNIMQGNGLMRYNNIFFALFSTFKQMFVTGSSRLMLFGKQVTNQYFVLLYYLSFCYLLSYIYLNIFYGLMMSNDENTQKKEDFQIQIQQKQNNGQQDVLTQKQSKKQSYHDQLSKEQKQSQFKKKPTTKNKKAQKIKIKQFVSINCLQVDSQNDSIHQFNPQLNKQLILAAELTNRSHQSNNSPNNLIISKDKPHQREQVFEINQEKLSNFNLPNPSIIKTQKFHRCEMPFETLNVQEDKTVSSHLVYTQIMRKYYIFHHIVVILCAINICIDYKGQSQTVGYVTDCIDFVFFCVYTLQMVFRYVLHSKYMQEQEWDNDYVMELCLFVFVCGDMVYEAVIADSLLQFVIASDHISLLLRTMKYLRLFILINFSPFFKKAKIIFNSVFMAIYQVRYFILLWFLNLIIFSIMGYHMFNGKTKFDLNGKIDLVNGKQMPISFEGLSNSIIFTAFAFFNQQWDWFLFYQYPGCGALIVLWQLLSLIIGLQVMSKYFMALLMNQIGALLDKSQSKTQNLQQKNEDFSQISGQQQLIPSKLLSSIVPYISNNNIQMMHHNNQIRIKATHHQRLKLPSLKLFQKQSINHAQNNTKQQSIIMQKQSLPVQSRYEVMKTINCLQILRAQFKSLLASKCYVYLKIFIILSSIVITLLSNPIKNPESSEMKTYNIIQIITMIFFGIDILINIISQRVFDLQKGYLSSAMNWIYLIVFWIQFLNIFPIIRSVSIIRSFMCLRILRIFIFVQIRFKNDRDMKITLIGFWKLLPKVINLLGGTLLLYGFFAIVLVKIYKNDFYYCDGHSYSQNVDNIKQCLEWGGNWIQRKMNVENFFQSLLYLFLQATTEGWSTQVIQAASLRGTGISPIQDSNEIMYFFFSAFFFFGNLIMLNAFLGLSIYNFKKIKQQMTGFNKLSQLDKTWLSIKNNIYRMRPIMKQKVPSNWLRQQIYKFMDSKYSKIVDLIFFFLFMCNMSCYQSNMSAQQSNIVSIILNISIGIFILEYFLTLLAYGVQNKQAKKFMIQSIAVVYVIFSLILMNEGRLDPRTSRLLGTINVCIICVRYFALLTEIEFIRKMINSLITVLPQTSNIWLLVLVILLIYATIGIQLFSYLRVGPELNDFDQNYTSLDKAIFALIKFSILQSPIGQVMDAASGSDPNAVCFSIKDYSQYAIYGRMGCGSKLSSYMFFLTFEVFYGMILMSTLMAVIFDAYSDVRREQQSMINKFQLQLVRNEWKNSDPEATGYISYRDFWRFTGQLISIYKINNDSLLSNQKKQQFLKHLNIAIYEDEKGVLSFQFHQVIQSLTRIVITQKYQQKQWNTSVADKHFKKKNTNESLKKMKKSFYNSSHVLTLITLKSGLRNWNRKSANQQKGMNLINFLKEKRYSKMKK